MKLGVKYIFVLTAFIICLYTFSYTSASFGNMSEVQDEKQEKQTILYIVDGEPMSAKEADKIDTEQIEKMEFVRENEQIRKYTDEDVEMVVLITMKKSEEMDTTSKE
jgi:hypothetical protein